MNKILCVALTAILLAGGSVITSAWSSTTAPTGIPRVADTTRSVAHSQIQDYSVTDHFSGEVFDARWTAFGDGTAVLNNASYWYALYHDSANTSTGDWRGPGLKAAVQESYGFDVSSNLKCVADEYPMGRAMVRLLDSGGNVIYSIGWEDPSNTNNEAQFFLTGTGDSLIYSTGLSYTNSIFIDKSIRIVRSSAVVSFYIDGSLKYSGPASSVLAASMEMALLKSGDACPLNPENMMFDSVTANFSPATPPSAPTGIAVLPSDRAIAVNWTSADPGTGPTVSGYRLYRGLSPGSELFLTTVGPVNGYRDTGLFNGLRYYYKVSAVSPTGESLTSAEISGVPRTVPSHPLNFQAIGGLNGITLSWSPPASNGGAQVTGYRVHRGISADAMAEIATLQAIEGYIDTNAITGSNYYYSVSAVNEAGEGPLCENIMAAVGAGTSVPSAPRSLAAISGDSHILLTWSAPLSNGNSIITKYSVYRGTTPATGQWLADVASGTGFNDTAVVNGQIYYYSASATNSLGEGPKSEEAAASPAAPGQATVPGAPENISAVAGTGHVLLSWYPPASDGGSPVTHYVIYRDSNTRKFTPIATVGPVFAYADTDVKPGETYVYSVSAVNGLGEGPISAQASATVLGHNTTGNVTGSGSSWLKDWTWVHSTVMLVLMGVGCAGIFYYMSHPEKEELQGSAAKTPDDGVDGKPDENPADEEAGH